MWVITLFEHKSVRIYEYAQKVEAIHAMKHLGKNAILSYTK
ncbi:hypothetical protein HNO89_002140 [Sporosarcina luteola]|nr:hypothetical protein [Sporosarcina luteola]